VRHAVDDLGPAMLVVAVAEDLLIRVAPVAVGRQQLLVLAVAGETQKPFRARELGRNLGEGRQQLGRGHAREGDVFELVRAVDLHCLLHEGVEFERPCDPQRVGPGIEPGEFIAPVDVAVDRGPHRALLRDQLHHDPFQQFTPVGFHRALRATKQPVRALGVRRQREDHEGECKHQDCDQRSCAATTFSTTGHCSSLSDATIRIAIRSSARTKAGIGRGTVGVPAALLP
jgi:hypothetical protein